MILDYPDSSRKRGFVILANCQGLVIKRGLTQAWPLAQDFRPLYLESWFDHKINDIVRGAEFLLVQSDQGARQINRLRLLTSQLPPFARVIRFPPLAFTAFWPYLFRDYNAPVDPLMGSQRFPWGDRFLIQMVRKGLGRAEIIDRYLSMDVGQKIPLDRMLQIWLDAFRQMEKTCDVICSDLILDHVTKRRTFFSGYHVADFVILAMLNRALTLMGKPLVDIEAFESENTLLDAELPVHPSVIRHFNIAYLDENTRYRMRWGGEMTAIAFYETYVDYLITRRERNDSPSLMSERNAAE